MMWGVLKILEINGKADPFELIVPAYLSESDCIATRPGDTPMTIAERYNAEAARLLPEMADRLAVDPAITRANDIDEIVFRRSEYLGGMACAILAMLEQQDGAAA
jgi:hypothetical protein